VYKGLVYFTKRIRSKHNKPKTYLISAKLKDSGVVGVPESHRSRQNRLVYEYNLSKKIPLIKFINCYQHYIYEYKDDLGDLRVDIKDGAYSDLDIFFSDIKPEIKEDENFIDNYDPYLDSGRKFKPQLKSKVIESTDSYLID
jgi:hypothetical protein